jgi:hypothetical protein
MDLKTFTGMCDCPKTLKSSLHMFSYRKYVQSRSSCAVNSSLLAKESGEL